MLDACFWDMQASIAERLFYGHSLDPVEEDNLVHSAPRSASALVGRILLSAIFLLSGIAKLTDPAGAVGYMTHVGIPHPETLVYVAGIAEILGGASLLVGLLARIGALGLIVMLVITTLYFHNFWTMTGAEAKTQMVQFMKNLAIMGGLATVFAHGPGLWSIDARLRRPKEP
jgi:putative oxidoreductase